MTIGSIASAIIDTILFIAICVMWYRIGYRKGYDTAKSQYSEILSDKDMQNDT